MSVHLYFLGTGGWVAPASRTCMSIALKVDENIYLFDVGEGSFKNFQKSKLSPLNIKAIFITHIHGDHILSLPTYIANLAVFGYNKVLKIISPEWIKETIHSLLKLTTNLKIKIDFKYLSGYNGELAYADEKIKVWSYRAKHVSEALMYKVSVKNKLTILYTGDTSPNSVLETEAGKVDVLIHDASFMQGFEKLAHNTGHSTISDAIKLALKAKVRKLILTHVGFILNLPKTFKIDNISVYVPKDLDVITLMNGK